MTYKRKIKVKDDLNKNPDKIDTSIGRAYLEEGKVKYLKK
jgi:hypothetical protein